MPVAAPKPCGQCGTLVRDGTSRCDKHKIKPGSFADPSRGTRHERGYGSRWDKLRPLIKTRDRHLCQECLRSDVLTVGTHVDHITPKAQGGTDDPSNLQLLCVKCHRAKTQREANPSQRGLFTALL